MSITYVAAGALSTGTATTVVALPAGLAEDDLMIMQLITGHPNETSSSIPSGWDVVKTLSGMPGTYGFGTGPRRLTFLARIATASETAPTISMPAGTDRFAAARIFALRRTAGTGWRFSASEGIDSTLTTDISATCDDAMSFAAGDFVIVGIGTHSSGPTTSAVGAGATGVNFGSWTLRNDDSAFIGGTTRLVTATASVAGVVGDPFIAPTVTGTWSSAHYAIAGAVRVREATATISATPQTASPPRILVVLQGMAAEKIVRATIERFALNALTPLRAADAVDVTGEDALVRTDGEQPFGVGVSYVATLEDTQGDLWTLSSNTVTTDVSHEVLSDAVLGIGVDVQIKDWRVRRYERDSTVFNVSGRMVVVSGPQPGSTSDVEVFTNTTAERTALLDLLARATGGIIQIRTEGRAACAECSDEEEFDPHAQVDTYLAVTATVLERAAKFRKPQRNWALSVVEVEPWDLTIEARGWTYDDVDAFYTNFTYSQIDTDFSTGTYLSVDIKDWGV